MSAMGSVSAGRQRAPFQPLVIVPTFPKSSRSIRSQVMTEMGWKEDGLLLDVKSPKRTPPTDSLEADTCQFTYCGTVRPRGTGEWLTTAWRRFHLIRT
jgi:hypothetical protein